VRKILLCIFSFTSLLSGVDVHPVPHRVAAYSFHEGLVLIGRAHDGVALASDGAVLNADGTVSEIQKIFPVGKYGAAAFAGSLSIQDPVGAPVREEVNVVRIASGWLDAHGDATVAFANQEINALVADALKKFFSTRDPAASNKKTFAIIFVDTSKSISRTATFYELPPAKGKPPSTRVMTDSTNREAMWIFGELKVQRELLKLNSTLLPGFQRDSSVKRIQGQTTSELSTTDYLSFFNSVLQAEESTQGRRLAGKDFHIAPPNRFATLTEADGFAWKTNP
jgi:hypothetical protein